jgi:CheY-like chemotaxis protein
MAGEYLESVGYTIIRAASGKEALQKAADSNGTIHLLLTDVVMPELSGPELAAEIASLRPRHQDHLHVRIHRRRYCSPGHS